MSITANASKFNEAHTAAKLRIDRRIYSKAAVLRACYWFNKDLQFQIEEQADDFVVEVALRVKASTLDHPRIKQVDEWLPDFFETLLDSQLRVEIQAETAAVRELIIAKAFAESGVLEDPPPGTFSDPVGDPGSNGDSLIKISRQRTS